MIVCYDMQFICARDQMVMHKGDEGGAQHLE
jgi:hypothetical protein